MEKRSFRPLSGFYEFLLYTIILFYEIRGGFRPLSGFYEFLSYSPDRFHCNAVPLDLRRKRKTPQIHEKTSF